MKKIIIAVMLAVLPALATAAEEGFHLDKAPVNLHDKASLQRGARMFANYCLSCHSAKYERYSRMAKDLGMTDAEVKANIMFASTKLTDHMTVAMRTADAKLWFGNPPPDLTLIARSRGADYLYTYLRSFYLDSSRPSGVNNAVFKSVAMPDVLWKLQGMQEPVFTIETDADGNKHPVLTGLKLVTKGTMTPAQYDKAVGDLVNFLVYMGEPIRLERQALGVKVLIFLAVFFVLAYLLKKEYWKDVH